MQKSEWSEIYIKSFREQFLSRITMQYITTVR